jgi:acetyltransferase-like isoleucine patch superfamily enzyme
VEKNKKWKDAWKLELKDVRDIFGLHKALRDKIRKKWRRTLPLNEELLDRWEKAAYLGFGKGSTIYDTSIVIGDVKVGRSTWVGPFTVLDGTGGLRIGDFCSISSGAQIYTHDSVKWALSGGKSDYTCAPVVIKDRCYIGPDAIISKGVTIGRCCVIGAHSLVTKDIPDNSIVFGIPSRIKGNVIIDKKTKKIKLKYMKER